MNKIDTAALLFYDALSGEFHPATDPQHRAHTLGRLCVATFQNGERTETEPDKYRYPPSWAAGTMAVARASRNGQPASLRLETPEQQSWAVFEALTSPAVFNGPLIRITDSTGFHLTQQLRLGPELNEIRAIAADTAQEFYGQ
jgi:hypothetical protein